MKGKKFVEKGHDALRVDKNEEQRTHFDTHQIAIWLRIMVRGSHIP